MATKKEQLEALLKFIDTLANNPENYSDFTKKLEIRFKGQGTAESAHMDSTKIDAIYEYCIEQIARADAKSFYRDFCIPEIIPQLEEDFIKMEHWRRRGNIAEFCLALYEQYECIVNKLGSNPSLNIIFEKLLKYHCYTNGKDYDRTAIKSEYPLYKLLFWATKEAEAVNRQLANQYAMDKYRAILYLCYYGALMTPDDYAAFRNSSALIDDLYKIRCTNHRGNTANEYEQAAIDRVNAQPIKFELKMLGHLADFIERINQNYPQISALKNFADSLPEKNYVPSGLKIVGKIDLSKIK